MLFKAYPTYMCSLKDIFCKRHVLRLFNNIIVLYCTTNFVQQHILLFNIHGLYDMFVQQHKLFLNNIYMLLNFIGHIYFMYPVFLAKVIVLKHSLSRIQG